MLTLLFVLSTVVPHHVEFVKTPPPTPSDFIAAGAKTFDVKARTFEFEFNPPIFVVNQGDSVSLTITSEDTTHGFFLQNYMTQGVVLERGRPVTVNFVASTPGTFLYSCTILCGSSIGHASMGGDLTVSAAQNPVPSITDFTPAKGPVAGGTVVAINGTNFQNNAAVLFGETPAVAVIVNSATRITAFTPARVAGSVTITVINEDGQSATSATPYTFEGPPPGRKRRAVKR